MVTSEHRLEDVKRFHSILDELKLRLGGYRRLVSAHGRLSWPLKGIYFFFEPGELRSDSGHGPRVVRIGTHALKPSDRTTLWGRLSQHRGVASHSWWQSPGVRFPQARRLCVDG